MTEKATDIGLSLPRVNFALKHFIQVKIDIMTTQEMANKYYELACMNKYIEIQNEYYGDNVISVEPEHAALKGMQIVTKGKSAVMAKGEAFRETRETLHSQSCSEPAVSGDFFSVILKRDITFKNKSRMQLEEIGIFHVREGKIILEQFFY